MRPTVFQKAELRDENDNIVQQGTYGKGSALSNSTNDGWVDYVMNNLEALRSMSVGAIIPVKTLPESGETGKAYVVTTGTDAGKLFMWDGEDWVEITGSIGDYLPITGGTVTGNLVVEGISTAVTPNADDNSTKVATTEYVQNEVKPIETDVDIAEKDIANIKALLQGHLYDYQTDSTSAYTKSVPIGAMPYAGLEKVGGKTIVWNQQFVHSMTRSNGHNYYGLVETHTTEGFTLIGTPSRADTLWYVSFFPIVGHKYLIKGTPTQSDVKLMNNVTGIYVEVTENFIVSPTRPSAAIAVAIQFAAGTAINLTWKPQIYDLTLMFGSGNEPTTVAEFEAMFPASYYSYNAGTLLSAGVTEVESVGKNLFNPNEITAIYRLNYTDGIFSNTYTDTKTAFAFAVQYYNNGAYISNAIVQQVWSSTGTKSVTFTATVSCNRLRISHSGSQKDLYFIFAINVVAGKTYTVSLDLLSYNPSVVGGLQFDKFQIEESATATAYSPYMNISYPIPPAIRNLEGYGWSAGSVYNYVDFERKVFVKNVGRVDMGTMNYTYYAVYNGIFANATFPSDAKNPYANAKGIQAVCSRYAVMTENVTSTSLGDSDKTCTVCWEAFNSANNIVIRDSSAGTDASAFKESLTGVYMYYELQTPVETDISAYLTDDNLINVEEGSTLTFPNQNGTDYQIPVPSEEEYMIDLQEALS